MDATLTRPKAGQGSSDRKTPEQELASMKAYVKRIKGSKSDSLGLLVAAGIVTKKGNLTKPYRSK